MKGFAVFVLFVLLSTVAMAASSGPAAFVKKSNDFCTYVCLGRGGMSQCDPAKFNCSVYIGPIFQQGFIPTQLIPCDVIAYISSIFPTLLGNCGIIIPEKDVFVSNIQLSSQAIILDSGRQTVNVTVRNTNDVQATVSNLKITIARMTSIIATCNFNNEVLGPLGDPNAIREFSCSFRPNSMSASDVAGVTNIDTAFDTLGSHKALVQLSAILPASADTVTQNDFAENFFAVVKETPRPVPEIGWIVLPAIALICLYFLSRKSAKKHPA